MMSEWVVLFLAGAAGLLLGTIFFGGLWWTVQNRLSSDRAALWFFGSLILRTGLVLLGFHLISQTRWQNLIACLLGFAASRIGVTLFLRRKGASRCA
jgi:F1F0 ATPase subunit 2